MQYCKNIHCNLEKYDLGFIIDDSTDDFCKDKDFLVVKTIQNSSLINFQEAGLRPEDHIKKKKEKQSTHIDHSLAKKWTKSLKHKTWHFQFLILMLIYKW